MAIRFNPLGIGFSVTGSSGGGSGANTTLSNLTSPTAINQHLLPNADATFNLGSNTSRFSNLYTELITDGSNNGAISITDRQLISPDGSTAAIDWSGASNIQVNKNFAMQSSNTLIFKNSTSLQWELSDTTPAGIMVVDGSDRLALSAPVDLQLTSNGDLIVDSGAGYDIYVNNEVVSLKSYNSLVAPSLQFFDKDEAFSASIKAPNTLAADYTLTLPPNDGGSDQILTTDGSGNLSFSDIAALQVSNLSPSYWTLDIPALVIDGTTADALAGYGAGLIFKGQDNQGALAVITQDRSDTNPTAGMYIATGNQTNSGYTGPIFLETGDATSGNSGSVFIQTGTSSATRGDVVFNSRRVDFSNAPIGSTLSPAVDNAYDIGNSVVYFRSLYSYKAIGSGWALEYNPTGTGSPSGTAYTLHFGSAANAAIYTENSSINGTSNMWVDTGNCTGTTGTSGDMRLRTGTSGSSTGNTGSLSLISGNSAAGASGDINFTTGTASTTRGRVVVDARTFRLPTASSAPTATQAGEMYYDTTTNKSYTWDGSTWQAHW
jgi:hypothetical protein